MRRIAASLVAGVLLTVAASGCVVRTRPAHVHTKRVVVRERACPPGYRWDGDDCRHRGRGHDRHHHHRD